VSYNTLIECGRELANDIKSGLIDESQLLTSGRAKLSLWLESPQFRASCLSDFDLSAELMVRSHGDGFPAMELYSTEHLKAEQEYRATNKKTDDTAD